MNKRRFLLILVFLSSFYLDIFCMEETIQLLPQSITLQWITKKSAPEFNEAYNVFVSSFDKAYRQGNSPYPNFPVEEAGRELFRELKEFIKQENRWFVVAKINEEVVGSAMFQQTNEQKAQSEMYIHQLSVDPEFGRHGIGKKLLFSILNKMPEIKKLVLITRRKNTSAINFYIKQQFVESEFMHEGYDQTIYIGFEKSLDTER